MIIAIFMLLHFGYSLFYVAWENPRMMLWSEWRGKYAARPITESVKILLNALRFFSKLKRKFSLVGVIVSLLIFSLSRSEHSREFGPTQEGCEWMNSWVTHTYKRCIKIIRRDESWGVKNWFTKTYRGKWKINQNFQKKTCLRSAIYWEK